MEIDMTMAAFGILNVNKDGRLKPCPFCGSDNLGCTDANIVYCNECSATAQERDWNKRYEKRADQ